LRRQDAESPELSTPPRNSHLGFAVPIDGVATTGIVRCDQPKVVDLAARNGRLVGSFPLAILAEVMARLRPIFA